MRPRLRLPESLLGFLVGLGPALPVQACGPFWPNRILLEPESAFLELPYSTFALELKQVPSPYRPAFAPVPPANEDPRQQTEDADLRELAAALASRQPDPQRRQETLSAYTAVRQALTAYAKSLDSWDVTTNPQRPTLAPQPLPEGLPGEFQDYLRGAIAYAQDQVGAAQTAWRELLARPPEQRRLRSTWAAFMLGRGYAASDPEQARSWYKRVRELVAEGYADSLGLAMASLGWEAQLALKQRRYAEALELYRVQLEGGEPSAPISLLIAARHAAAEADAEERAACVRNPTARRLITGYLLSASLLNQDPRVLGWLESIKARPIPEEEAERLAWWAYRSGDWAQAKTWLDRAPAQAPIAQWLRAKLLLREGQIEAALPLIAAAAAQFPPATEVFISRDIDLEDSQFDAHRAQAEIGSLQLSRGEYIAALEALLLGLGANDWLGEAPAQIQYARHWLDVAYVAEQVLTAQELKDFVDRRWPMERVTAPGDKGLDPGPAMRHLLARRLARQGRLAEAASYFPAKLQGDLQAYAEAVRLGQDTRSPAAEQAAALWNAAQLARHKGMELLGTETDPDWAALDGAYDLGVDANDRPTQGVTRRSAEELSRTRQHRPAPDRRFHYRWQAADFAWKAAALMPDKSPDTARVLAIGGTWLKTLDPKGADRFYKALVRRCGNTDLGKQAAKIGWFPEL